MCAYSITAIQRRILVLSNFNFRSQWKMFKCGVYVTQRIGCKYCNCSLQFKFLFENKTHHMRISYFSYIYMETLFAQVHVLRATKRDLAQTLQSFPIAPNYLQRLNTLLYNEHNKEQTSFLFVTDEFILFFYASLQHFQSPLSFVQNFYIPFKCVKGASH